MDAKLNVISESAGISLDEAKMALELAEGDVEQALHLVPYVEKTIFVIHGKFSCARNPKLYGIFRIISNGREGLILDLNLALSFNSAEVDASIAADPEAFEAIVNNIALKTDHGQAYAFKLGFYEHLGAAEVNQMYQLAKEGNLEDVQEVLRGVVGKVSPVSDKNVDVEIKTYIFTCIQAEKKGLIEEDFETKPVNEEAIASSQLSIYLDTEPLISPVKGKTIDKFVEYEPLPLKITDEREAGKYLGRVLSDESGIAIGRIKEYYLSEHSNRYNVTVEFGPKIMGKFILDPNVRITTYSETPVEELKEKTTKSPTQVSTFLVVTAGIILLFLMLYIFSR